MVEEHQSVRLRLPPLWRVVTRQWQFCVYFRSTFLVHFCFFFLTCLNLLLEYLKEFKIEYIDHELDLVLLSSIWV